MLYESPPVAQEDGPDPKSVLPGLEGGYWPWRAKRSPALAFGRACRMTLGRKKRFEAGESCTDHADEELYRVIGWLGSSMAVSAHTLTRSGPNSLAHQGRAPPRFASAAERLREPEQVGEDARGGDGDAGTRSVQGERVVLRVPVRDEQAHRLRGGDPAQRVPSRHALEAHEDLLLPGVDLAHVDQALILGPGRLNLLANGGVVGLHRLHDLVPLAALADVGR
mmetsp:Transcript_33566/g.85887  ORF Transcript_33566/g.85887 Transcript_33566/m.85887 type:complete len:223 (+) Transcript_33566:429-1097(+)